MITYFDTSSLVKLLIEEEGTDSVAVLWGRSELPVSVSLIEVEARAALAAAARIGRLSSEQHLAAKSALAIRIALLNRVAVTRQLVAFAGDLAEEEKLRGCDAVHLAAALHARVQLFSSADAALCAAASRRGLHVAHPSD